MPDLTPIVPESVKTLHLMASPGFLNNSPQHRTYWTVDRDLRYGGAMGNSIQVRRVTRSPSTASCSMKSAAMPPVAICRAGDAT